MFIFPTKNDSINVELYILRPQNCEHLKSRLATKFKAKPDSEHERIVIRISFILFNSGKSLNEIYEKFFKEEYNSFFDYLEQEEGFEDSFIEDIKNHMMPKDTLWKVKVSDYEGYNFSNLFDNFDSETNDLIEILNNALMECDYEN